MAGGVAWLGQVQKNSPDGVAIRKLKVGHGLPESHPVHEGILHFAERVKVLSGGKFILDVFPSSQLGSETQMLEKVQSGTLDFTKTSAAPMGNFVSAAKVFSLPYLFRDRDHYWKTLDGEIGNDFLLGLKTKDDGEVSGFRGLAFYDAGSRNFYSKSPIKAPADLGGSPTALSPGELYTALKQGVVDSAENNPPTFVASRHYEITKNFTFDHHSRIPDILVVSSKFWDSLSPLEQDVFLRAADESSQLQRNAWSAASEAALTQMREAGVEIFQADVSAFAAATKSVIGKHAKGVVKDLYDKIQQVN